MGTLRRRFLSGIGAVLLVGLLVGCGLAESGGGDGGVTLRRLTSGLARARARVTSALYWRRGLRSR
jgi:hypothetical protein